MTDLLSVVVPARNEAATIGRVVNRLLPQPWVGEVLVVDNGSDDGTATAARAAGARNVTETRPGMGYALRAGMAAASHDWVMKVDADLDRFDITRFSLMAAARADGIGLIKGNWQDPADNMPMTRLLVMPAISQLAPGLATLRAPNSGIYLVNRAVIAHQEIVGSYAADLDVMLRVYAAGARVAEVDIGQISHDTRDLGHYNAMAETIMSFFLDRQQKCLTEEIVVVANDAAEVINSSLGLLAARARAGALVHIYLQKANGPRADVLRDVLAPLPTARVLPLDLVPVFRPRGPEGRLRVIAPYPAAHRTNIVRAALDTQANLQAAGYTAPDLLLMPTASRLRIVRNFRADHAFDAGDGAVIKLNALERLRDIDPSLGVDLGSSTARETFQSYASLPEALKLDLTPDAPRAEASGPA